MTNTTAVLLTIPARFERATPGFGGRGASLSALSDTERSFPYRPHFAGFGPASDRVLSAEYHRLTHGLAQTRHSASEG